LVCSMSRGGECHDGKRCPLPHCQKGKSHRSFFLGLTPPAVKPQDEAAGFWMPKI
jgi:hypothetical protein